MSDYQPSASGRPQGRGRGNRNRRSGPSRGNSNSSSSSSSNRPGFRPSRKPPEPTGFQKFLKIITFGLYSPQTLPQTRTSTRPPREAGSAPSSPRSEREPRENPRRENRESRPPRSSPVSAEVNNERLYVGNLSYDATESDLFELFNGSGSVKNAEVVVNSRTQRSKGFAFVTMTSIDGAKKAVADLNGKDFMGRPLIVGGAKPLAPRDENRHDDSDHNEGQSETPSSSNPELAA